MQLKTSKEKEDFAKKLTELHRAPSTQELADLVGEPSSSSKHHQHLEERQQLWKELASKEGTDEGLHNKEVCDRIIYIIIFFCCPIFVS